MNDFEKTVDKITAQLADTLKRKNHDYGDSFAKIYKKRGDISTLIRLEDKLNRFETLINKDRKVNDESIEDTLLDMAGYCILTLVQKHLEGESHEGLLERN